MSLTAASFHEVYELHGREVYRFALYLSGNTARAEDLTSEAFLRIWSSPAPVQVKTVRSYLLTIVRNLYFEAWRREKRETPLSEAVAVKDTRGSTIEQKSELQRVLAALQQLDPVERSAVLLRSEHGMSYDEVAQTLGGGITAAAARVKVHRARQKLLEARKGV